MQFSPNDILNAVDQVGGDRQQASQLMQGIQQIDPQQHSDLLNQLGIDPQQLQNGGYGVQGQSQGGQQQGYDQNQGGQQQGYDQNQGGQNYDQNQGGQNYDQNQGGQNYDQNQGNQQNW